MNIEFIENGMELSQVREILNEVILKINQEDEKKISFYDLTERPCINGVELTENTTAQELHLTLSQLENVQEIESMVAQIGSQKAEEAAKSELESKLDRDFSKLPDLKYNFNENMLLTINDGNNIFKATISDMLLYLKYLILKDTTFEKFATGAKQQDNPEDERANENEPSLEHPIDIIP